MVRQVDYFFFFNDTATTEIYTLSLHDALPICHGTVDRASSRSSSGTKAKYGCRSHDCTCLTNIRNGATPRPVAARPLDRKSTRLNSSHANISYAVFCLKKKN